jgi:hypothetical protein
MAYMSGKNRVVLVGGDQNSYPLSDLLYIGTPVLADEDRIVTTTNMKVGAYTIAAQPDVPRNITLKRTVVSTTDTPGTVVLVGTNINDEAITETLTVGAHATEVVGTKAFKSLVSVTGVGWVIGAPGENDTIIVGVGTRLGLPYATRAAAQVKIGIVGTAIIAPTVVHHAKVEESTVDLSAGTYDGSKKAWVYYSWE